MGPAGKRTDPLSVAAPETQCLHIGFVAIPKHNPRSFTPRLTKGALVKHSHRNPRVSRHASEKARAPHDRTGGVFQGPGQAERVRDTNDFNASSHRLVPNAQALNISSAQGLGRRGVSPRLRSGPNYICSVSCLAPAGAGGGYVFFSVGSRNNSTPYQ